MASQFSDIEPVKSCHGDLANPLTPSGPMRMGDFGVAGQDVLWVLVPDHREGVTMGHKFISVVISSKVCLLQARQTCFG